MNNLSWWSTNFTTKETTNINIKLYFFLQKKDWKEESLEIACTVYAISRDSFFFATTDLIILVSIRVFVTADYFQSCFFEINKKKKNEALLKASESGLTWESSCLYHLINFIFALRCSETSELTEMRGYPIDVIRSILIAMYVTRHARNSIGSSRSYLHPCLSL